MLTPAGAELAAIGAEKRTQRYIRARNGAAGSTGDRGSAGAPLGKNTNSSSPPPPPPRDRGHRARAYQVRDELRPWASPRCGKCGRVRVRAWVTIGVRVAPDGTARAHFNGPMRCGSVWECAVCALQIRAERASEIERAASWWRGQGGGLLMLTLTVRHATWHDGRRSRAGLVEAWGSLASGAPWQRWCAAAGLRGWVRALETTHGGNGWHPHLHALLFVAPGATAPAAVAELRAQLAARWGDAVARKLGEEQRPDLAHGCDLRPAHVAGYLSKIALELTAAPSKVARAGGHRTPMQIALDFLETGDADDLELWQAYCRGMKGAKFTEWSRGRMDLRAAAGLGAERSDEEIVAGDEGEEYTAAEISGAVWDGSRGWRWEVAVLEAAERGDVATLARLGARPPGPEARPGIYTAV